MNVYRDPNSCYFHPKEKVVGVCALCLNEKLLILASRRGRYHHSSPRTCRKTPINLSKIFAFSSFISRLEFRHWKPENSDDEASTSQEDSFISINFGKNGVGSWEENKVSEVSLENCILSWNHHLTKDSKETKTVIEHSKTRASLRWRKRIGHLFQLIRRKRSNKGTVCHVEGVKTRKGWIRALTRSRNTE
ncbi:uncharacterized protein LOC101207127 [Cucumis sativus]|uniref:Uncharacterized protein n=1 Tax=Cucumis sativus TaxID=3659 RepID=A0A0A0KFU9_CUCSA|nr:uncharacterized protein LOC101207127 [Cucumis sativus]KGN47729.1 hypothetical protein Csa_018229 [Cucumis sativus]